MSHAEHAVMSITMPGMFQIQAFQQLKPYMCWCAAVELGNNLTTLHMLLLAELQ